MAALARGLNEAVKIAPPNVTDIHVFADNQAALASILSAKEGPAQLTSIAACASVRPWLEASKEHYIHLWWCPGHQDVPGNVEVDREAGEGVSEASNAVTYAYARQTITAQACAAWKTDMNKVKYRGHNNLLTTDELHRCKHTSANWFLKTGGRSNTRFAQTIRFVSGHFPHGGFRERFHLEGMRECWCGQTNLETRDHVWFDCNMWIRTHKPPEEELERRRRLGHNDPLNFDMPIPEGDDPVAHYIQEWRKIPPNMEEVAEFLRLNPMVGTFAWADLVAQAKADRDAGEIQTIAILKVTLHTEVRKKAYDRWVGINPAAPVSAFNQKFAKAAVRLVKDKYDLTPQEEESLKEEFGSPVRTTERKGGTPGQHSQGAR